ncbi:hypothetical protein BS47DRAFT_1029859 [Hydnum rufescens UP504]|uniref:Uncharacterized protein n=1 Tax=Hydnum rufescens UP504 TaxID=1448309 RepID=A0A9P6AVT6_9AGAM|nr:hypothetical protein BS47DRAFT_1029859 [Hydnum rufescens UP504]
MTMGRRREIRGDDGNADGSRSDLAKLTSFGPPDALVQQSRGLLLFQFWANISQVINPSSIIHTQYSCFGTTHISPQRRGSCDTPYPTPTKPRDLCAMVPIRLEALSRVAAREQRTIEQLGLHSTRLRFVSFVRHAAPDNGIEYSVRYLLNIIPERWSRCPGAFPILLPVRVDIDDVKILAACEGQHCAVPTM